MYGYDGSLIVKAMEETYSKPLNDAAKAEIIRCERDLKDALEFIIKEATTLLEMLNDKASAYPAVSTIMNKAGNGGAVIGSQWDKAIVRATGINAICNYSERS